MRQKHREQGNTEANTTEVRDVMQAPAEDGLEEAADVFEVVEVEDAAQTDEDTEPETQGAPEGASKEKAAAEEGDNVSYGDILSGDILTRRWLRGQMGLVLLCTVFAVIYITNRYSAEQEAIETEKLKTELTEMRYRALTRSGELTVRTRQSQVENALHSTADSVLQTPDQPPFIISNRNHRR